MFVVCTSSKDELKCIRIKHSATVPPETGPTVSHKFATQVPHTLPKMEGLPSRRSTSILAALALLYGQRTLSSQISSAADESTFDGTLGGRCFRISLALEPVSTVTKKISPGVSPAIYMILLFGGCLSASLLSWITHAWLGTPPY